MPSTFAQHSFPNCPIPLGQPCFGDCPNTFAQPCFCSCPNSFPQACICVFATAPILLHNLVFAWQSQYFCTTLFSHDRPNTFAQPCFRMTVPIILHSPIVFLSVSVLFLWLLCCDFRYLKNCPASASRPLCVSLLMAVKRSNRFTFVIRHQLSQNIL